MLHYRRCLGIGGDGAFSIITKAPWGVYEMSNYVKVSVPRMKSDSEELHAKIEKIPQFIHELDASMKALGDCWTGYSWESF